MVIEFTTRAPCGCVRYTPTGALVVNSQGRHRDVTGALWWTISDVCKYYNMWSKWS